MDKFKGLDDWLVYLESAKEVSGMELGLSRIDKLAQHLSITKFNCPVVTIAGTNGKGSCAASLEALAISHGKKVGCYSSPHIFEFLERIRIDGNMVSESTCCESFSVIKNACEDIDISLTYFEFVTAAALYIFKHSNLDLIVLEVGLGGRLDAVNIVENTIGIITSVSYDHCEVLGETLEQIAFEKSGIFKNNCWAIFNNFDSTAKVLQRRASESKSNIYSMGSNFSINESSDGWSWTNGQDSFFNLPLPSFPVQNSALALTAFYLLFADKIKTSLLSSTFRKIRVIGRFDEYKVDGNNFVLDLAHNYAGASWLLNKVKREYPGLRIKVIFQPLARKDWTSMVIPWLSEVTEWVLIDNKNNSQAVGVNDLKKKIISGCQNLNPNIRYVNSHKEAVDSLIATSSAADVNVVFGSFYNVGNCLKALDPVGNLLVTG